MKNNYLVVSIVAVFFGALVVGFQNCAGKSFQSLQVSTKSPSIGFEPRELSLAAPITVASPVKSLSMDVNGGITVPSTGTPTMNLTIHLRLELVDSVANLVQQDPWLIVNPMFDHVQNPGGPASGVDSLAIALTGPGISYDPYLLSKLLVGTPPSSRDANDGIPPALRVVSVGPCSGDVSGKFLCWTYQGENMGVPNFNVSGNAATFFNEASSHKFKVVVRATGHPTYQESVFEANSTLAISVIKPTPPPADNCPNEAFIVNPVGARRNLVDSYGGGTSICAGGSDTYLYVKDSLSGFTDDISAYLAVRVDNSSEVKRPSVPYPLNVDVIGDESRLAQIRSNVRSMVPSSFASCIDNHPNAKIYPMHLDTQAYNANGSNTFGVLFIRNPIAYSDYTPPGKFTSGWVERATLKKVDGSAFELPVVSPSPIKLDGTNYALDCQAYPLVLKQHAAANGRDSVSKDFTGSSWLVDKCDVGLTPYNYRGDSQTQQINGYFSCFSESPNASNQCGRVVVGGITTGIYKRMSYIDAYGVCHDFGCGPCYTLVSPTTTPTTQTSPTTQTPPTTTQLPTPTISLGTPNMVNGDCTKASISVQTRNMTQSQTAIVNYFGQVCSLPFSSLINGAGTCQFSGLMPNTASYFVGLIIEGQNFVARTNEIRFSVCLNGDTNGNGFIDHGSTGEVGRTADGSNCSTLGPDPLRAYPYDSRTGFGYVYRTSSPGYMCWYLLNRNGHGDCLDAGRFKTYFNPLSPTPTPIDGGLTCCSGTTAPAPEDSGLPQSSQRKVCQ